MGLKLIARELYRLQRDVESLEKQLAAAPSDQREAIAEKLRKARAEHIRMRRILDGNKDPLLYKVPR